MKLAARSLGARLQFFEARTRSEFDEAFRAMTQQRVNPVLIVADALFVVHRAPLADLEGKHRLPSMHTLRPDVEAAGLISYGPDIVAVWRRAAVSVDKILKGAKPAELPGEQPTKFEVVINRKTARALGLTIPKSVLLRADQVIQ